MYIICGYYLCKNDYVKLYVMDAESTVNDKFCGRRVNEILVKDFTQTAKPEIVGKKVRPIYNSRGHIVGAEVQ